MPLENLEDQGLEKNPNLELPQLTFQLTLPEFAQDKTIQQRILDAIKRDGKLFITYNIIQY